MDDSVAADRDIDLVLVTGAGASREFGVNRTKVPRTGAGDALVLLRQVSPFDPWSVDAPVQASTHQGRARHWCCWRGASMAPREPLSSVRPRGQRWSTQSLLP
jgi:hypothetical protein